MTTFLLLWFGAGLLGVVISGFVDRKILKTPVRKDINMFGATAFYSLLGFATLGLTLIRVLLVDNRKIARALHSRTKSRV